MDRNKHIELLILRCFFNVLYFWTINLKSEKPVLQSQTLPRPNSIWNAQRASIGSHFQIPNVHVKFVKSTLLRDFNRRFGNAAPFKLQKYAPLKSPLSARLIFKHGTLVLVILIETLVLRVLLAQRHPMIVFCKISVRRNKNCLEFSIA